eukprot:679182_1
MHTSRITQSISVRLYHISYHLYHISFDLQMLHKLAECTFKLGSIRKFDPSNPPSLSPNNNDDPVTFDELISLKHVVLFGDIQTSSQVNRLMKSKINAPSAKTKQVILELEGVNIIAFNDTKERGQSCWVAREIVVNKVEGADEMDRKFEYVKSLIVAPRWPKLPETIKVSWSRFCERSGDTMQ